MRKHGGNNFAGCTAPMTDWRVLTREGNYSAFNGYRFTPSNYSSVTCIRCHCVWRTKAPYVAQLVDATLAERGIKAPLTKDQSTD